MTGQNIAYKRVSSVDQNLDRQLDGVEGIDRVFEEKISGYKKDRPELEKCLNYVREGDTLHVHSLDRLARNLSHLLKIVSFLREKNVTLRLHKEGWTFGAKMKPMDRFMLQIFGSVAEYERELIRERQAEGIAVAKANGKFLGRKPIDKELRQQIKRDALGVPNKKLVAKAHGVSVATVYNILREPVNVEEVNS